MRATLRWLTAAAASPGSGAMRVFAKAKMVADPQKELRKPEAPEVERRIMDLTVANMDLLMLLKERDLLRKAKYDFHPPQFLIHAQQAYRAVAEAFEEVPREWTTLSELLPQDLFEAVKEYVNSADTDKSCIPKAEEASGAKIVDIRYTKMPPPQFPALHPYVSFLKLFMAIVLRKSEVKAEWESYLRRCADWYQSNVLIVDVLYLIFKNPNKLTSKELFELPEPPVVQKTHLWTFQRDQSGEWNIVAMDH
eukprot:RCo015302